MALQDTPARLLTPREVAERLQFTTARPVYRLIREGKVPASRVGKRLLIDPADLQAMLDAARSKPERARRSMMDVERER